MKKLFSACLLALAAGTVMAQATPAGLWKTIDDKTKTEKSLVRISESGGVFTGKIEKILTEKTDAKCTECTDERKDQPTLGMTILRDIKPVSGEAGEFEGGDILDPADGKVYKVKMKLADGGKKLEVRGYVGVSLLGRTQTWLRVE